MVTLTYDTKLTNFNTAWLNIGNQLNKFLSNIKRDFGSIEVLRCFESFKKGSNYPHIHLILMLNDTKLPCFRYTNKKGKTSYRVEDTYLNKIKQHWHSYIQIEAVRNMGAIGYILKYITKEMYTKDDYSTISLLWLFHKQSYSISNKFTSRLGIHLESLPIDSTLLDSCMPNSNIDFDNLTYLCSVNTKMPYDSWYLKLKPPPQFENEEEFGEYTDIFSNFKLVEEN